MLNLFNHFVLDNAAGLVPIQLLFITLTYIMDAIFFYLSGDVASFDFLNDRTNNNMIYSIYKTHLHH